MTPDLFAAAKGREIAILETCDKVDTPRLCADLPHGVYALAVRRTRDPLWGLASEWPEEWERLQAALAAMPTGWDADPEDEMEAYVERHLDNPPNGGGRALLIHLIRCAEAGEFPHEDEE